MGTKGKVNYPVYDKLEEFPSKNKLEEYSITIWYPKCYVCIYELDLHYCIESKKIVKVTEEKPTEY